LQLTDAASGLIQIGSQGAVNNVNIGAVTGAEADTVNIDSDDSAVETVSVGSTDATSTITLQGGAVDGTNNNSGVIIGYGSSGNAALVPLDLSNSSTFAETTADCSTSLNEGAMYYNSNASSQSVRACVNGIWNDLVSTDGLGVDMYGVLQGSGGTDAGDLTSSATAGTSGPCKVSYASTTSVSVSPCTAYSSGRKMVVASAATVGTLSTANDWYHICFSSTTGAPVATTSTSETATMPTWSATAPILCLADVQDNGSGHIEAIFDTRVFASSIKEEVTTAAGMGLGWIACPDVSQVTTCANATAGADTVEGVIAQSNGSTSTTTPNAIMVVSGLAETKVNLTGITAGQILENSTTADRVTSVATTGASTTYFANLGITRSASPATACSATPTAANCDYQGLVNLDLK